MIDLVTRVEGYKYEISEYVPSLTTFHLFIYQFASSRWMETDQC